MATAAVMKNLLVKVGWWFASIVGGYVYYPTTKNQESCSLIMALRIGVTYSGDELSISKIQELVGDRAVKISRSVCGFRS